MRRGFPLLNQSYPLFSWDQRHEIGHIGSKEESLAFATTHLISCAKQVIEKGRLFSIALSGGSTPQAIFQRLFSEHLFKAIDWSQVLFFWSDERAVPPTHPDSNFRMAMDAGLKNLPIPQTHIFRMQAEREIEKNAQAYQTHIENALHPRGRFDLVMLGVGEDGHTASLFPKTKALEEKTALVVANQVPQKNTYRMTLTYPCIHRAKQIVIYAFGQSKASIVKKIFTENSHPLYPVSFVGTRQNKALWILDTDAATLLMSHRKTL